MRSNHSFPIGDDAAECFYLRTRTLGSYVYSDMELEVDSGSASNQETEDGKDKDMVVPPIEPVALVNSGTGVKI